MMTPSARVIDIRGNTSWLCLNSYDINHLWEYCLTHANENSMLCVLKHIYTSIITHLREKRQSTLMEFEHFRNGLPLSKKYCLLRMP